MPESAQYFTNASQVREVVHKYTGSEIQIQSIFIINNNYIGNQGLYSKAMAKKLI